MGFCYLGEFVDDRFDGSFDINKSNHFLNSKLVVSATALVRMACSKGVQVTLRQVMSNFFVW